MDGAGKGIIRQAVVASIQRDGMSIFISRCRDAKREHTSYNFHGNVPNLRDVESRRRKQSTDLTRCIRFKEGPVFVVATVFALAVTSAAPAPIAPTNPDSVRASCVAPSNTGTFRITTTKTADGSHGISALLLLENIGGCLEATFITDGNSPAAIDRLSLSGDTLKGSLNVAGGSAQVVVKFDGSKVAGSIVERRTEWRIEGRKTS
jgi:hypothetical protein